MEYLIPPWQHQLEAIERAKNLPYFALLFEMGAGKTPTAINILRHKFNQEKRVLRTLIYGPPIVVRNWKEEWLRHAKINPGRVVVLTGSGKQRLATFVKHAYTQDGLPTGTVFITNYESLLMPDLFRALTEWHPEALVFDESHMLKDAKAKRTKLAMQLAKQARYRYILSGSPVLNSPLDLFSQFLILDGGETFGQNFFAFRGRYFRDKNAGMPRDRYFPKWEIVPGALDEINRLIFRAGMRVTKAEVMQHLPPMVRETRYVPMSPEQAKLYKEMKRDLITFLKDKACTAQLAITKALRLQQIASGYLKTVDGEEVALDGHPKKQALRDLLEEITPTSKVLVWAVWKQNYEQIRQVCVSLGLGYVEIHGEISEAKKVEAQARFRDDPSVRVLIGHPDSGGVGVNLVTASYSIFYSRTFSLKHSLQAEARNHRGGSEIHERITRIDLVTEGTIDELVTEKLASKTQMSDTVLRDLSLELENQEA